MHDELASAIGLITAAANRCGSDEARTALAAVQARLQERAELQQALEMPEYSTRIDATAYLYRLCRAISNSRLESDGVELSLSVHPLRMNSERCWLVGMIAFEAIMDAARNGAGSIQLELRPSGAFVECCISDDARSAQRPADSTLLAVVEALAGNLGGTIEVDVSAVGSRMVLSFPAGS
jgi:two-component sensor histidine kinase